MAGQGQITQQVDTNNKPIHGNYQPGNMTPVLPQSGTVSQDPNNANQLYGPTLAQIGDGKTPTQMAAVDSAGNLSVKMNTTGMPAIVQKVSSKSTGAVASLTAVFTSNNTVGNSIVVVCGVGNGTAPTVADSAGNTYYRAALSANSTTFESAIFYATNILAGANTITVTNAGTTASMAIQAYEMSGLIAQASGMLDQSGTNTGTGTTATTTALVPASPNEYAFAGVAVGTATQAITATTGTFWAADSSQNPTTPTNLYSFGALSLPLSTTASLSPTATIAGSEPWAMAVATFKPAALGVNGTVSTNADATITPGTAPAKALIGGGVYNSTSPTLTNGQTAATQLDSDGSQYISVRDIATSPAIVQKANGKSTGSVASIVQAFASANIAGNSIVVVAGCGNGTAVSVTDSAGNTYISAANSANSTTFETTIWYAVNIIAGANTVTVTNNGATASMAVQIYEVAGLIAQAGNALDQTATNNAGSGTAVTTTPLAVNNANELAFMGVAVGTAAQAVSVTAGTAWALDSTQNTTTPAGLYTLGSLSRQITSQTPFVPAATIAGSEPWAVAVATFRTPALNVEGTIALATPYPANATPITGQSGDHGATSNAATLTAVAGKTTYITGFSVTSTGSTGAAVVDVAVTGTTGGTLTYVYATVAGATLTNQPLVVNFPYPIPASAVNTNIVVTCPSLGTGNTNCAVNAYGFNL